MFRYIIRDEHITGKWITANPEQVEVIENYVKDYRAAFTRDPVGLHYLKELGEFVLLSPTEDMIEGQ